MLETVTEPKTDDLNREEKDGGSTECVRDAENSWPERITDKDKSRWSALRVEINGEAG